MEFNFRDSSYKSKFKAKGIAWRGKQVQMLAIVRQQKKLL